MYQLRFRGRGGGGRGEARRALIERLEMRQLLSSYFVSPGGSGTNPGTLAQPFGTIQEAANVAQPGDTVYIRGGTYHETVSPAHSGTASAAINFVNYNGEAVTITGADPITGWTEQQGSVYGAPQPWDLGAGNNQVFVDGQPMTEARWPNAGSSLFQGNYVQAQTITSSTPTNGPFGGIATATITSSQLTQPTGYWNGTTIHIAPGEGWAWQTGTVVHSEPGSITYTYTQLNLSYQIPRDGNSFYLTGKFQALDSPGEWFRDSASNTLYLWAPGGDSPAGHDVEVKQRQYAFDLSGLSYVNVSGIKLFAASIRTDSSSQHLAMSDITAQYVSESTLNPNPFASKNNPAATGIVLNGNDNVLSDSTIAYSSGNGVALMGNNDIVQNCFIHDVDYIGGDESAILIRGSNDQALHNTVFNTGRNAITDYFGPSTTVEYNVVHDFGLMTSDAGGFYAYKTEGSGSIVGYNLIYNGHAPGFGDSGLFLDNGTQDFILHHNAVWNVDAALKMNGPAHNIQVYNNTLVATNVGFTGYPDDMAGSVVENNLLVGGQQWGTGMTQQDNLLTSATNSVFADPNSHNFQLAAGSPAIDAGMVIPGYTDGYTGAAPDLGAYEHGVTPFASGAATVKPPVYTPSSDPPTTTPPTTTPPTTTPPATTPVGSTPPTPVTHNAAATIAAASFDSESGIQSNAGGITGGNGSWVQYALIDFGTSGVKRLQIQLAALAKRMNLRIQLRIDSLSGPVLATANVPGGNAGMRPHLQKVGTKRVTGVHALYLVFTGRMGQATVSSFSFVPIPPRKVHVKPARHSR